MLRLDSANVNRLRCILGWGKQRVRVRVSARTVGYYPMQAG